MFRQVPIWNMISTQNFMEIWLAISTLWLVHCCRTTEKWPTPCVYGAVVLRHYLTYPQQFFRLIEWWSAITSIALGFLIFLPDCRMFKPQAANRTTGLPKDNIPHPYLYQCFSMTIQSTPAKFGVSIVRQSVMNFIVFIPHIPSSCGIVNCQLRTLSKILPKTKTCISENLVWHISP